MNVVTMVLKLLIFLGFLPKITPEKGKLGVQIPSIADNPPKNLREK